MRHPCKPFCPRFPLLRSFSLRMRLFRCGCDGRLRSIPPHGRALNADWPNPHTIISGGPCKCQNIASSTRKRSTRDRAITPDVAECPPVAVLPAALSLNLGSLKHAMLNSLQLTFAYSCTTPFYQNGGTVQYILLNVNMFNSCPSTLSGIN
jgi:hypothetical protein